VFIVVVISDINSVLELLDTPLHMRTDCVIC